MAFLTKKPKATKAAKATDGKATTPKPQTKAEIAKDPLQQMAKDRLINLTPQGIDILPAGRLLARSVCMLFDHYLNEQSRQRFSRVI